jgi:asparagine synthase (glutamine-hydrolysing)
MCGIFGIFRTTSPLSADELTWMRKAEAALRHRGPDGSGVESFLRGECALGHTRLAIIDLEGGAQPLFNEDRTIAVICNGEIYNHVELRQQLELRAHRFRTHSDCEVLAHLYEERGDDLLAELEGMFAFALLDQRNRRLLLARDRFGEKPLYWHLLQDGTGIAFASEMKGLLGLPNLEQRLDVSAVAQFLALRYIPAPRTHMESIRKLRAGESLAVSASGVRSTRYWRPQFVKVNSQKPLRVDEAVEEVRRRAVESVRIRLRSDVTLGAFLSGGVDSTFVVCAIRELQPGVALQTFCASFEDEKLNEAPIALRVAQLAQSQHEEVRFTSLELLNLFPALIDHYDEPFADVSMFPTFAVCRAARKHCKVMLSGDGGDECFAGYREYFRYRPWNTLRNAPGVVSAAKLLLRQVGSHGHGSGLLRFLSTSDKAFLYPEGRYKQLLTVFASPYREQASSGLQELEAAAEDHLRLKYPASMMEGIACSYLPEQVLVKVDRASMRSSLECRTPFLDRNLFEFAAGVPLHYHFARSQGKALLRAALPKWIPEEIRWREKQGFTPPLAAWLRSQLKPEMQAALDSVPKNLAELLDFSGARALFQQHLAGADHSDELFRWLVLTRRCEGLSVRD